jgi:hypothetical protein
MTTLINQPDETTAVDTRITGDTPDTNFGTDAKLDIGKQGTGTNCQRTLIKPDFTGLPAGAELTAVSLTLTFQTDYSLNTRIVRWFRCLRNWTEGGATWNKYDGTNAWGTAGGGGAADINSVEAGNVSVSDAETMNTGKVFQFSNAGVAEVQQMFDGLLPTYGFLFKADTESNDLYEYYSSSASTASYRPKWTFEYEQGYPKVY